MTSPQPLEILDLRLFSARQMRPLLEAEAEEWFRRLRWEYGSSTELLLQYLDSRILPGFVALNRGRICGYTFCVYEGQKAVIGDLYVAPDNPEPLAVAHTLAKHLLEVLEASPEIFRVEAQLLLFDSGQLSPAFKGFEVFPRLFLERELHPLTLSGTGPQFPEAFDLAAWTPHLYDAVAQMIHAAYQGSIDSGINDQYRTLAGAQRFLHNIIRFPGCGTFDPENSWVLRERSSGALVGTLLCSRVAAGVAHLTQLCLAPEFRAQGLGSKLLDFATQNLAARGYRALTLTVSEGNRNAVALYLGSGFEVRHRFDALVRTIAKRPAFRLAHFPPG